MLLLALNLHQSVVSVELLIQKGLLALEELDSSLGAAKVSILVYVTLIMRVVVVVGLVHSAAVLEHGRQSLVVLVGVLTGRLLLIQKV